MEGKMFSFWKKHRIRSNMPAYEYPVSALNRNLHYTASAGFNFAQEEEIRQGCLHLPYYQQQLYLNVCFTAEQMREIRTALESKIRVISQQFCSDPVTGTTRIMDIEYKFEPGLPVDKVKLFAKPELSLKEMKEIRAKLEQESRQEEHKKNRPHWGDIFIQVTNAVIVSFVILILSYFAFLFWLWLLRAHLLR